MSLKRIIADTLHAKTPKLSAIFSALYGYIFWQPQKSYSLYGEDLVATHMLNEAGIKNGVYVDIGAFHPRWISNTHKLSKSGWRGVVVDVDKNKLTPFSLFRKRVVTKYGAVVPKTCTQPFITIYKFKRMCSEFDTISETEANAIKNKYNIEFNEIKVPALRIDLLLREVADCFKSDIDYLNIDIEGMDDEVLKGIDLREYGVKCLQFENGKCFGGSSEVKTFLDDIEFSHLSTNGGTHTYISNELLKKRFECIL